MFLSVFVLNYSSRPTLALTPGFVFYLTFFNYDGKGARDVPLIVDVI